MGSTPNSHCFPFLPPPFPELPSHGHARRILLAHAEHISSAGMGGKRGASPSTPAAVLGLCCTMFFLQPRWPQPRLYPAGTPNSSPTLRVGVRDGLRRPHRERLQHVGEEYTRRRTREKLEARENN